MTVGKALNGDDYDQQWSRLSDFIKYNPGARHRRRLCLQLLDGLAVSSCLDVGCGPGDLLLAIRRRHPELVKMHGVDLAPRQVVANRCAMPWAEFEVLDIEREKLSTRFDLVTCCEVIEHVANREAAFANLSALVAPSGYLLITCPTATLYETEKRFGHVSHPDALELRELGKKNGLAVVRSLNWGWPTYRLMKWATNINPDFAIRQFGSGDYSLFKRWLNQVLYIGNFANVPSSLGCQLFYLFRKI